jgi:hypothetical protein
VFGEDQAPLDIWHSERMKVPPKPGTGIVSSDNLHQNHLSIAEETTHRCAPNYVSIAGILAQHFVATAVGGSGRTLCPSCTGFPTDSWHDKLPLRTVEGASAAPSARDFVKSGEKPSLQRAVKGELIWRRRSARAMFPTKRARESSHARASMVLTVWDYQRPPRAVSTPLVAVALLAA